MTNGRLMWPVSILAREDRTSAVMVFFFQCAAIPPSPPSVDGRSTPSRGGSSEWSSTLLSQHRRQAQLARFVRAYHHVSTRVSSVLDLPYGLLVRSGGVETRRGPCNALEPYIYVAWAMPARQGCGPSALGHTTPSNHQRIGLMPDIHSRGPQGTTFSSHTSLVRHCTIRETLSFISSDISMSAPSHATCGRRQPSFSTSLIASKA